MKKRRLGLSFFLCIGVLFSNEVLSQDILSDDNFLPIVQEVVPDVPKINYTWSDFLIGESCQDDYTLLDGLPFLTPEQESLKSKMMTYCLSS